MRYDASVRHLSFRFSVFRSLCALLSNVKLVIYTHLTTLIALCVADDDDDGRELAHATSTVCSKVSTSEYF